MKQQTKILFDKWISLEAKRNEFKHYISQKFMLEFNYNSNHIEGNTLTYGQTELLLLFGKVVGDAKMQDLEEMKAHNVGLKIIIEESLSNNHLLSENFIRQLHKVLLREDYKVYRQLADGAQTSYTVHAGQYKTRPNSVITRTGERFEYASVEETPALMSDLIKWYNKIVADESLSVIELAALFHYRYIRIHPFEDGNGRIARLLVNYILSSFGYPMIVVPSKYKSEYLSALNLCDINVGMFPSDGANAQINQITSFVDYIEKLVINEMQNDILIVNGDNENQWWYDGEIIKFSNKNLINIINTISENPSITIKTLSKILNLNSSAIQKHLKFLQEKSYLMRTGNRVRGQWIITLTKL